MGNYRGTIVQMLVRKCRTAEVYQVRCWQCFTDQELPAKSDRFSCRKCGADLRIEWRNEGAAERHLGR